MSSSKEHHRFADEILAEIADLDPNSTYTRGKTLIALVHAQLAAANHGDDPSASREPRHARPTPGPAV